MKARYTLGPRTDEIISKYYRDRYGNWRKMYYHYDALGNVRVLTDEAGEVGGRYEYSPFGYPLMHRGKLTIYNNYTYTGRQWERMSKLYYYRTRYYDSQTGRFTSVDRLIREVEKRKKEEGMGYEGCEICGGYIRGGIPEEIKQEELIPEIETPELPKRKYQQPYVYVENNPVNEIDPEGKTTEEVRRDCQLGCDVHLSGYLLTVCCLALKKYVLEEIPKMNKVLLKECTEKCGFQEGSYKPGAVIMKFMNCLSTKYFKDAFFQLIEKLLYRRI